VPARHNVPDPEPGVYNERTALAWQRTALSLLAGSAVVARLAFDDLGLLAVVGFLVSLPLVAWVMWESQGRYHHSAGVRMRSRPRGGRAPTALATVAVVVALTELASILAAR
jgi:uncharacterized membrane protein YidH (DUF202 family)